MNQDMNSELVSRYERATLYEGMALPMSESATRLVFNENIAPIWIAGSQCFFYQRKLKNGSEYRLVNALTRKNQAAFNHSALAKSLSEMVSQPINKDELPISRVQITLTPLTIRFRAFQKQWRYDVDGHTCTEEETTPANWVISPDGRKAAFTQDYNLWIKDLISGEEKQLTDDGEEYYMYAAGTCTWGKENSPDGQLLWSPDSQRIFTAQRDTRQVKFAPCVDYVPKSGNIRPVLRQYKAPFPGDEHVEKYRLLSIDVNNGSQQAANYRKIPACRGGFGLRDERLAWWGKDSRRAYFVELERGECAARVVEFDTFTGATRIVFEEISDINIHLSTSETTPAIIEPLPETDELIWFSERSGWAHLYLYDTESGELKNAITQGNWLVRELLHVDINRRELYFQAGGRVGNRDPYYLDICRVQIDTGDITTLVSTDHDYLVFSKTAFIGSLTIGNQGQTGVSPCGDYIVATRSRVDEVPVSILLDRDGNEILTLETADVSMLPEGYQWPEPVKLLAADGKTDIYGVVYRPSNFSPDNYYPVIDCSQAIPEFICTAKGSFGNAIVDGLWQYQASALAELGFIVVTIDGRGTPYRSRAFRAESYGWIPSANKTEDRIAGLQQLAERFPYMDLNRVGIIGFNGAVGAVYGMLEYPDFYKVGVSHCLQDARVMTHIWGEQYEGLVPRSHKHADEMAENLKGKLLMIHGVNDPMDPPIATFRMAQAFQLANKDFDMLMLPNEFQFLHIGSGYAIRRTWDYFVKHLLDIDPPKDFRVIKNWENQFGVCAKTGDSQLFTAIDLEECS